MTQSKGTSVKVEGHEVQWDKWSFRVGFNPREDWCCYTVGYDGRPVLYRASIAEMMVPYADPKQSSYHKNVFDLGEYGVGVMANSLALGCDCLGTIQYFDGHMADSKGRVVTIKNAICLHEEDFGMLWKHTDWRTSQSDVRRARRMAVSMVATVGNYDYGFYWYLYQDGTIQMEVKLTGIMNTTALKPGEPAVYGTEVAPGLNAPYHQHYFNARLDFAVDGEANTVQEVKMRGLPAGPDNPFNSAFRAETTPFLKELEAHAPPIPLSTVLARHQPRSQKRYGPTGRIPHLSRRKHLAIRVARLIIVKAGDVFDAKPLGDAVRCPRNGSRPVSIPTRIRAVMELPKWTARTARSVTAIWWSGTRSARLIPAARGLAGDARRIGRIHASTRRFL